jgi:folate-binding protein YgfZ
LAAVTAGQPDAQEIAALGEGAALVDRSYMGRLAITGPESRQALGALATNDIEGLEPGTGCFAACCTAKGRMLGEIRVLCTPEELFLDMERVSLQPVFDLIRHGLVGYEAELHKRTLETSALSLLGPRSREVAGASALGAAECDNAPGELGGAQVLLAATNLGVDVICAEGDSGPVREDLVARGALPSGIELAELARVEAGRPRYGIDLDETVIPQEAGLNSRLVNFEKGCYVGQETIARLHYRGRPNRRLCLLSVDEGAAEGDELSFEGRQVGTLTSIARPPGRGAVALALVRREAPDGSTLHVGTTGAEAEILGAAGS